MTKFEFTVRQVPYKLVILDEQEMGSRDPTVLLFRNEREEAIATVHLDPACDCGEHVVAPRFDAEDL